MKKWVTIVVVLVLLGGGFLFVKPFLLETSDVKEISAGDIASLADSDFVPTFTEATFPFVHEYKGDVLPFNGSALIDIDGDGVDEVFIGAGEGSGDAFMTFENGAFIASYPEAFDSQHPTYSAISIDVDDDRDEDLFVVRGNGIYLYYNNGGEFTPTKVITEFSGDAIPFSLAPGDINKDGFVDLYVSTWIEPAKFKPATYNDEGHKTANVMLLNNGDNTFTDVTDAVGLTFSQNTFLSSFVDLDNDGALDLVVATNTDTVRVYANDGNGKFTEQVSPTVNGFWMGMAIGDIDNDGDEDLFFSNSGTTIPLDIARGDLRSDQESTPEWALIRNDGNFAFTDITNEAGLSGLEFGWGAMFGDLNLNGLQDLVAVGNYIKWPAHKLNKGPGRVLLNGRDGVFLSVTEVSKALNKQFGTTPLISDFNGDGYNDIVYINIDGPSLAYINSGRAETNNHYLKVDMPDNASSIGARVVVELEGGQKLYQQFTSSLGLLSDPSSTLVFGLGQSTEVEELTIYWPNGEVEKIDDLPVDSVYIVGDYDL